MIDLDMPFVLFGQRSQLPSVSGIYLVTNDATVLYVGRAINLRKRWRRHHRAPQMIDAYRIYWRDVPIDDLAYIERGFIKQFQPQWNSTLARRGRDLLELLPRRPREHVAALMQDLNLDAREVIVRAILSYGRRSTNHDG